MTYGIAPKSMGLYDLSEWKEYLHYMYLPISIPGQEKIQLPQNLEFARQLVEDAITHEQGKFSHVYVTARRGFATPGNPLNRPGWHADGFGTGDINHVWTDRYPTLYAIQDFNYVSIGHNASMRDFEAQIRAKNIVTYQDSELLRLDPFVIHSAPEIPAPGGVRSFFKVSFSNAPYNLEGNSHNYLLDYDWPMYSREATRNDPAHSNSDKVPV